MEQNGGRIKRKVDGIRVKLGEQFHTLRLVCVYSRINNLKYGLCCRVEAYFLKIGLVDPD